MEDYNHTSTTYSNSEWNITYEEDFENVTDILFSTLAPNKTTSNTSVSKFYPFIIFEMILSIICLIFSIVVYSILPEFKNVHGKNLISISSCLLTTYVFLCLDVGLRLVVPYSVCFIVAVIIHVTFLATFFWTNIMAFDIWSNITSMKAKCGVKNTSHRYLKYSLYAWPATILTALPAFILESTDLVAPQYRPNFGVKRCWLSGTTAFIYYFNLPVGVILFGNLIMFILTIRKLWLIKKMTAILQVKQERKRLNLFLKLFFVMGIIWFTEFLPWITKIYKLYALAGILTALHGVLLCAIFVFKKRIILQFVQKLKEGFKPNMGLTSSSTTSTAFYTSQSHSDPKTHLNLPGSSVMSQTDKQQADSHSDHNES